MKDLPLRKRREKNVAMIDPQGPPGKGEWTSEQKGLRHRKYAGERNTNARGTKI